MKKCLVLFLGLLMVFSTAVPALADVNFDITPFEETDTFEIEFDETDNSYRIKFVDDSDIWGVSFKDGDIGSLSAWMDVMVLEDYPPVIRIILLFGGEKENCTDKIIIKPDKTRYSFDVETESYTYDKNKIERAVLILTGDRIQMLKDIVDNDVFSVDCRFVGDRNIETNLFFTKNRRKQIEELYTLYEDSGALDNDFSVIEELFPCTIK